MSLRVITWFLRIFTLVLVLGIGAWAVLLREVPQRASNDPAWIFNHGSIGNEAAQGLPYWIWRVLPAVFPDLLPGTQAGYSAVGIAWRSGAPLPIGFSQKTLGVIPRVAPNCAFCHQGSYRLTAEDPATIVTAGAGTRVDVQAFLRFLTSAAQDPRFTASVLMPEILARYDMPLWERALYRYLLIPAVRGALQDQAAAFAWTNSRTPWGIGRIDPFNPVKFGMLGLREDGTLGNSDMMPLWGLAVAEPTAQRRPALHWDGLLLDLHETVVAGAIGDGMTHKSYPGAREALEAMEDYIRVNAPPPSPFSPDRAPDDPFYVAPEALAQGRAIYQETCAGCHAPTGARFRTPIPIAEVQTDRHRLDMWTQEATEAYTAYQEDYAWGFEHFQKTQGYLANELSGLWLRGPYLHNGSVPHLRALLMPPEARPRLFWRGSDLVDTENGGFVSTEGGDLYRYQAPFDTTLPGNGNGGHPWGTDLPEADKAALLAYLKTL